MQPTSSRMISCCLPAFFPTQLKIKRDRETDLEIGGGGVIELTGVASPYLLNYGGVVLDHVGGHARAPAKPRESGVHDSGGASDLPRA
jgi:hypothetical protein